MATDPLAPTRLHASSVLFRLLPHLRALVDIIADNLDGGGKPKAGLSEKLLGLVAALAEGVRGGPGAGRGNDEKVA